MLSTYVKMSEHAPARFTKGVAASMRPVSAPTGANRMKHAASNRFKENASSDPIEDGFLFFI
jgi:hypothetical protein